MSNVKIQKPPRTQTEQLLHKLDLMEKLLKGDDGRKYQKININHIAINYKIINDPFEKIRFNTTQKLKDCETFLDQRDKLKSLTDPKVIVEKRKLENKTSNLIEEVKKNLKELKIELESQKRKPNKFPGLPEKESMVKLMNDKLTIIQNRLDNIPVNEKEEEDNRTNLEKLEEIIERRKQNQPVDREIYQEEQDKIDEWNREVADQDKELEEVHGAVKELKKEVKMAGKGIDDIGVQVKHLEKHTDKTADNLNTQNRKLKDLLKKIRKGDKFCVNLVLLLIILGLIAVLYSIIKKKFF